VHSRSKPEVDGSRRAFVPSGGVPSLLAAKNPSLHLRRMGVASGGVAIGAVALWMVVP